MSDPGLDLTRLTDAQLGALKMVGGDLTKLPDAMLISMKDSLAPKEPTAADRVGNAVSATTGGAKKLFDYAQTAGARIASGALGAPSDLTALGNEGAKWALEKMLGPSPRSQINKPYTQLDSNPANLGGDDAPKDALPIPAQTEVMPGSHDIKKAILGVNKSLGVDERNLGDVKALTLHPFGSNINLGKMADAGIDTGVSMLAGPGGAVNAARNVIPGIMAGVSSEAAGQATAGSKWEIPARITAALTGGGATMLAQTGAKKAEGMLAPWTQGGKERLAQDVIGGAATDPKSAVSALGSYRGDAVPGVTQTAAKITADPGLLSLENFAGGTMGANQRLDGIVQANNAARTAHLGGLEAGDVGNFVTRLRAVDSGLAADVDRALSTLPPAATPMQAGQAIRDALAARQEMLTAARRTVTQPLYDEVAQWTGPVNSWKALTTSADQVAQTKGATQADMKSARSLLFDAEGKADKTAQGLTAARQDIGRTIQGTTHNDTIRRLKAVQGAIDESLEASVPAARSARQEYARMSAPLEPFSREQGSSVFNVLNERRPMDVSMVPQTFLQPGQRGAAGVRSLQATGAPGVVEPMQGYVGGMVREQPQNAGRVTNNFGPALDQLDPTLRPRIGAVQSAADTRAGFQASPAGRMATGNDAAKELGTLLAAKDGRTQIADMVMRSNGDQAALKGLRQGILDDFKATIESKGGTDVAGNQTLMSAKAKAWVDQKMQNARVALTPEQEKGIRALVDSLDVQSRTAPKMAGSDTVRNAMSATFMGKILNGSVANIPGIKALLQTANTQADVIRIVAETLADPQAAKVMLMKYSAGNAKIAEPIFRRLSEQQSLLAPQELGGRQ